MFVRGGLVSTGYRLLNAGHYGYYWSSVGYIRDYAYSLYFDSGYVRPTDNTTRYTGLSVRCVALGG